MQQITGGSVKQMDGTEYSRVLNNSMGRIYDSIEATLDQFTLGDSPIGELTMSERARIRMDYARLIGQNQDPEDEVIRDFEIRNTAIVLLSRYANSLD